MSFNFDNERPIFIQIVEEIERQIVSGSLSPGEKLPSVREYAMKSKVNPNTMQKALSELENMKLIYTERTNGKYVTKNQKIIKSHKEKFAKDTTLKYLTNMKELGFTKEEIKEYLNKIGGSN